LSLHYVVFDTEKIQPARQRIRRATGEVYRFIIAVRRALPQEHCRLYHNDGDGTFTDVSERAGIAGHGGYGLTAVAADFDGDGWPDIYVACDSVPSLLFRKQPRWHFPTSAVSRAASRSMRMERNRLAWGWGSEISTTTGHLDIFKNAFQRRDHQTSCTAITARATFRGRDHRGPGLAVETRFVGWGAAIQGP